MNRWLWLDIALKLAVVGQLLFAVVGPDLQQFEGKAMEARAIVYPLAILVVPAVWLILRRRRPVDYPYALDIIWTLPFFIDVTGNTVDLYDTVDWWDDGNHFVNWGILVAGFGQLLIRMPLTRLVAAGLAIGFGAVTAILWEFAEYAAFIHANEEELRSVYTDTLGDLALGLSGSIAAALIIVFLLWPVPASRT